MWLLNSLLLAGLSMSQIRDDEQVVFYPTYATFDAQQRTWTLAIHGNIHEPDTDSRKRQALIDSLRRSMQLKPNSREAQTLIRRMRPFLVDNERGKDISVRIGDREYPLEQSESNGHFQGGLSIAADLLEAGNADEPVVPPWIRFQAVLPPKDKRLFAGQVRLIPDHGFSIISDIDDTIKDTHVTDRHEMLANTLLRDFRAVPDMAKLYQVASRRGVAIHYVSGSPWQLYPPLALFLRAEGFPDATFHLKHYRIKDSSLLDMLGSQTQFKRQAIREIMKAFPGRRFLLIGDSGEQDPEIYGQIARTSPDRIVAILIRNVTDEQPDNARMINAADRIDRDRWRLFEDAAEIRDQIFTAVGAPVVESEDAE
ncbi:MAG: App1 family protein [Planctomycetota bacterium]|nr:App1 family protein [Planctomycetota bacterium]